jgi:adenosine/AMP kinase
LKSGSRPKVSPSHRDIRTALHFSIGEPSSSGPVLNALRMVPEVCRLFCATANPTEVVLPETEQGLGILGVVDGFSPKGVEAEADIRWRKDFLRQIGSKL